MKKLLLSASAFLSFAAAMNAQQIQPCGMHQAMESHLKNVPGYAAKLNAVEAVKNAELANSNMAAKSASITSAYTFTIPVVFHVLHLGENIGTGTNVSDALLTSALAQVNRDFARLGSDTTTIDPMFDSLYINSRIHFELAKKDPLGNCTNGIVRHYNTRTNWAQSDLFNYQYSTMAPGNWNPSKYLNIYIVKNIIDDGGSQGIIVGYTYLPGTSPIDPADAIAYRYDFLSGLNSRSLSHEIGHWLGLSHTFGGSNNAGTICGNDDISDTPRTSGFFSNCPQPYTALNDSCDPGKRPNINNIMDYSSCPKMFTKGQTAKMRNSLQSMVGLRKLVVDTANLIATGILDANGNPTPAVACAPVADFSATKFSTCAGQTVTFNSTSFNSVPSSYSWAFEGGNPSTSNSQTQSVSYDTPGTYSVSLTVSNGNGTSSKTVNSFITVDWNGAKTLPYTEDFEGQWWPVGMNFKNEDLGTHGWEKSQYGANFSNYSTVLPNANYVNNFPGFAGNVDIMELPPFDFTNTTNISISYDYSFARKTGVATDTFKLQYSLDCGGTWLNVPGMTSASQMAASGGTVNAPYIPWSSATTVSDPSYKWKTKTIIPAILTGLNNKRDVKIRFWFQNDIANGQSQNLYIDNINISGTVGLNEFENSLGLSIYPNPTSSSSVIEFTSPSNSKASILVYDVTGRIIEEGNLSVNSGVSSKYTVNSSNQLNSGVYFVSITIDGKKVTKKLIIE